MSDSATAKHSHLPFRLILVALAVLAFCTRYLHYTFPGPSDVRPAFNTMLLDHIASIVQVCLLLVAAIGLGSFILRRLRYEAEPIRAVALGLGAISLLVLLLGALGLMDYAFLALMVVLLGLFGGEGAEQIGAVGERMRAFILQRTIFHSLVTLTVLLVVVLNIVRCFIPPLDYDVLEYHLGAPAQYVRDGRIHFLDTNVYAAFPSNVEMLYLFALGLKADAIRGAALAGLINVSLGLLAALAAGSIARRISVAREAGFLAAAAFYVFPWASYLSIRHYVELGMVLFALAAIGAFIDYLARGDRRLAVLAGIFAGLSAGCKYPAVLFLVLPMAAAIFVAAALQKKWKPAVVHAAIFVGVTAAVLSPWLIKNTISTGNPTYPLLYGIFDGANWSPEQDAKWQNAHLPKEFGIESFADSAWRFLREPEVTRIGPAGPEKEASTLIWLPVLIGVVAVSPRSSKQWLLVGFALVCLLLWYATTHRIARFIAPWFMILLVPVACSMARAIAWRKAVGFGIAFAAVLLWTVQSVRDRSPNAELFFALGMYDEHAALEQLSDGSTFNYPAIEAINKLPAGSKVLMVGEAETFYCQTPVVAPTVFDRNPIEDEMRAWDPSLQLELKHIVGQAYRIHYDLRKVGFSHIYVNLPETRRLRYSYAYEHQGRQHPGYLELTDEHVKFLRAFLTDHCELAASFGEPMPVASVKPEDNDLFAAIAGGTVQANGQSCFRSPYALWRLK